MSIITVGLICLIFMLFLIAIGVPIAFAMSVAGIIGNFIITGVSATFTQIMLITWDRGTDFIIVCIPLFIFMGQLTSHAGIAADLYSVVQKWLGRLPGGLAVASIFACGGFGAVTGSSVACVATMGAIVYPEMKKYHYDAGLATGVLASAGTLGILIPPSLNMAFYGILTDTSIAALFIAGIIPGLITISVFSLIVIIQCLVNTKMGPLAPKYSWKEKIVSLKSVIPIFIIFGVVIGTLYGGVCTPTEAAGIGAVGVFVVCMAMKRLTLESFRTALRETGVVSAFMFLVIVGGYSITRFLVITDISQIMVSYIQNLNLSQYELIFYLVVLYTFLGCVLDVFGMIILTIPFVFPILIVAGIDPVWFGVFIVIVSEIALITPPVGINVFIMRSVAKEVPMGKIFWGILPFLIGEYFILFLLSTFPQIVTWLPSMM